MKRNKFRSAGAAPSCCGFCGRGRAGASPDAALVGRAAHAACELVLLADQTLGAGLVAQWAPLAARPTAGPPTIGAGELGGSSGGAPTTALPPPAAAPAPPTFSGRHTPSPALHVHTKEKSSSEGNTPGGQWMLCSLGEGRGRQRGELVAVAVYRPSHPRARLSPGVAQRAGRHAMQRWVGVPGSRSHWQPQLSPEDDGAPVEGQRRVPRVWW